MEILLTLLFAIFYTSNTWAADIQEVSLESIIKTLSPNHHIVMIDDKVIFDDQNDKQGFDQGLTLESESNFGDRIHYIISQSSKDANCSKTYRIITIQNSIYVSGKFGQCLKEPSVDKYNDGSMDVFFEGKKKFFFTPDNEVLSQKTSDFSKPKARYSIEDADLVSVPSLVDEFIKGKDDFAPELKKCDLVGKPITVNDTQENYYLFVTTAGACGWGAANGPMWIVKAVPYKPEILFSGGGAVITPQNHSNNNFWDIAVTGGAASDASKSQYWIFDDGKYRLK